jgi:cell division protein FtsN
MAARRGKSQARRNGNGGGKPTWVWLAAGILIGVVVIAGWQLRGRWNPKDGFLPTPDPNAHAPATTSEPPIAPDPGERPKPTFDFYKILPEKEVVIPDAELAEQAEEEARRAAAAEAATAAGQTPAPTPPGSGIDPVVAAPVTSTYVLQAGAYSGESEPEALNARIALTGEVARVEAAQINGTTVYRVRMGPYASAGTLAAAKQALVSHGIEGAQAIHVK